MIKQLKIDDDPYEIEIPDEYPIHGRLTYLNGRPGLYAKDIEGKSRFFRAKRVYPKKEKK